MKKTNLISKLTTSCIINEVVNEITEDVRYKLNQFGGNESEYFYRTLEYIEEEQENFKAELFLAMKDVFKRNELILLQKSNTDSRNFLIAYNKLCKYFKSKLTIQDIESFHMTQDEVYAMLFDYMSSGYEDKVDPNAKHAETKLEKSKLKNYNEISEMFVK